MSINWALCCRKFCCCGSNDEDENPLLGCRRRSDCTNQLHDPGCVKNRSYRNQERNRACITKSSTNILAAISKPSTNVTMSHIQLSKNIDPIQNTAGINKNIPDNSTNCLNKDGNRNSDYTRWRNGHSSRNLDKSTGAIKKLVPKRVDKTCRNIGELERNAELEMSGALRQYDCQTLRQGQPHGDAVDFKKPYKQMKPVHSCETRLATENLPPARSALTNTAKHSTGGCCGDLDGAVKKSYAMRVGPKTTSNKRRHLMSKSDCDVGTWFEDQSDAKSITVSLSEFKSENYDARQSNKTLVQDYSIGCFHLQMGDVKMSSGRELPKRKGKGFPNLNSDFYENEQDSHSPTNVFLDSPKNLSAISFDELSFGTVKFKISYYNATKSLFVHIIDVQGMPPKGEKYFYGVMLKLSILPTTKRIEKTHTVKNVDMNPYFSESFTFIVNESSNKVLKISAYDADLQGKYNALGHAMFHLESAIQDEKIHSYRLLREPWVESWPGWLEVSLNYNQITKNLNVTVHRAEGLNVVTQGLHDSSRSLNSERCDSFAEVIQYCAEMKLKVKRTSIVINTWNPQYNSSLDFNLSSKRPHENFIVISVKLKSLLNESELGRVIFGPLHFASGLTRTPWGLALSQNHTVTSWYKMCL